MLEKSYTVKKILLVPEIHKDIDLKISICDLKPKVHHLYDSKKVKRYVRV